MVLGRFSNMEYHLHLPVDKKGIKKLHVRDILYLSGNIFTARDVAHQVLLSKDQKDIPFMPSEMALYHCGPLMKQQGKKWFVVSAGPTTSNRIEVFQNKLMEKFQIPIIIGKGGMGKRTGKALQQHTAVYTVYPGGAGALAAESVEEVVGVHWLKQLGMPEAVWVLKMKDFGPLVVAMDSHGGSLLDRKKKNTQTRPIKIC